MKDPEQLKEAIESLGGEFELIRELGQGATAVVYLLRDHALDRDVAMKVIRATFAGDDEAIARLQREARLVAQLTHPNIVKLFGTHRLNDGSFALFMEHVPGRNLKELLREEGAFSVPKALRVLRDVASALAYAHRRRIVHRDVKPENIYIDEEVGAARLADFGVARPWDQDARLTLPGASLGTPAYMSPEQIDGQEVDGRSDVYSLGLVGYEILLGHHPWEGENVFTIIYRQKNDELSVDSLGLGSYPALAETLERALEKDPARRMESAVAFMEKLSEIDGAPVLVPPSDLEPIEDDAHDEGFSPVDWDTVEATPDRRSPVPAAGFGGLPEEDRDEPQVLGAPPRRRWALPLAAVLAAVSFGVYKWQPWTTPTVDPGAFIPVSPQPPVTVDPMEGSEEDVALGPTGLRPTRDSTYEGAVGSLLPLTVRATNPQGNPLADTLVVFRVNEGNGILETEEVRTDRDGVAQANLRLPNRPGEMLILAQVPGPDTLRTLLPVTAKVGLPQRVIPISGEGQSAGLGQALAEAIGVRVVDEFGNPVPETQVRFQALQGGGTVGPPSAPTDEDGRAFARWTLGNAAGIQMAAAVVVGAEDALLSFQATAVAPAAPPPAPEPESDPLPTESDPPGTPRTGPVTVIAKTFAVGGTQVCHLVGGTAICRGTNNRGQGGDRNLSGLVGLATGISHTCGLDATGGAWCWGANESGQLGDGSSTDRRPAGAVDTQARFSVLAAGLSHTCGLGAGGQAICWGQNTYGQLGIGSREDQPRPVAVSEDRSFQDLVAGWRHTCGLASGSAFCWGTNSSGQIGDGSQVDRLAPTRVSGSFQALAAGAGHTCGISGSEVLCWGNNDFGQLGDGTTQDRSSPASVSGLPGTPMTLAAGANHTCAVLTDRSAYCWGQNLRGQLGDGTTNNRSAPVAVSSGLEFVALYAGGSVTCGFARDGSEYCWGLNQSGQLGDGTLDNRSVPVRVGGNRP